MGKSHIETFYTIYPNDNEMYAKYWIYLLTSNMKDKTTAEWLIFKNW